MLIKNLITKRKSSVFFYYLFSLFNFHSYAVGYGEPHLGPWKQHFPESEEEKAIRVKAEHAVEVINVNDLNSSSINRIQKIIKEAYKNTGNKNNIKCAVVFFTD